ncbi:MAG TPA: MaoC family dehydratase [Gammaproteobacteria bacterium]|nr:acyl dehydratase [Acidiferrobacteraceae bacterium]MDP6399532.1 MaoC family dehydratase N-terminal domain-containing protein [Arenicellales bacterium]HCX87920.1 MaoC family dehydratase [Gammaproteobacteria bacterium]MDP6552273.1 MaoC family dehydratase N-terminal domain-containing protein [Arenicellales bacterium]MDP6790554.1 MaoC family dehydratase N-terminal domain-containing protein [Arenicellales bacterium]
MHSDLIGKRYEPFVAEVDKWRVRFFAHTIGETNPACFDEAAARKAGYRSLLAPVTLPFSLAMDFDQSLLVLEDLGVELKWAVHGEQGFVRVTEVFAGDTITGEQQVCDIFEKKNGALLFVVTATRLENQLAEHVADMDTTIVVRQPQAAPDPKDA